MLTKERIKDLEELGFEWTRSGEHHHHSTSRTLETSSNQINNEHTEVDWIAAASDQSPLAPLPTTNEEGKSFLQEALELGFSSNYLANKTEDEARMLIHIVTTVRRRTQEESGLNASRKLFERIESALERGHSASFLVNKTEEEVQVISTQDPPPRKETARKPIDIMYPGNDNSISGCQVTYPYGNYCTTSSHEQEEHNMFNGHQLVRKDSGMMITSHEQDEQPSEEHVSTDDKRTIGPCTCKNTNCLKLYCVCLAAEEYCHDECSCNDCQNLPRYDAVRNEAILEILAKNRNAFNKQSNPCKCKNSFCLKKYCDCFAAGRRCESSCKCINCKNYDGCEAPMAKSSEGKNSADCGTLVHLPTNGEAEKSEAVVQRQYQIAESARKSNAKALAYSRQYTQHYNVQQYQSGYNPYYPYGHPQMMIMPPVGEGYSTLQGGYPHLPSSRIDEPPTKDAESETSDSDATVPLNNNDDVGEQAYTRSDQAPIVHDPLEENDQLDVEDQESSSEDESDVSENESEANNYDDDMHSENDGHSSDDDHSLPDDDSRIRRPSAFSWMQKRGSSTSLLNRPKQSSTQARGTGDVFNYWMAKKSSNQHLPVSNALRNQTTMTGNERLPAEAVEILKAWISSPEHVNNPYPTPEELDDLLQQTGIDRKQLHGWFGNARAKLKRLKTQSATSGAKKQSQQTDEKTTAKSTSVGVRQVPSGKWEVRIASYHKTRCYIGMFETIDKAELANKVARTVLMATKDAELTAEEINENIMTARSAAKEAAETATLLPMDDQPAGSSTVSTKKRKHEDQPNDGPVLSEGRFDMWLANRKRQWAQNRQKRWEEQVYTTKASLSSDTFSDWLSSRKRTWEAIRQRKRRKIQTQLIDPEHNKPSPQRKTGKNHLPTEAVSILKVWMSEHIDNPYPTKEDKEELMKKTGIDGKQLRTWFNNARASMKKNQSKHIKGLHSYGEASTVSTKKRKHGYQSKDDPVLSEERFEYNKASLSSDTFSDWLSSRKKTWEAVRHRKKRKFQSQQIDPPDHSILPSPQRKTSKYYLPKEAVALLKDWMSEHIDHPYPTKEDKQELMKKTGIDEKQIQNWLEEAIKKKA